MPSFGVRSLKAICSNDEMYPKTSDLYLAAAQSGPAAYTNSNNCKDIESGSDRRSDDASHVCRSGPTTDEILSYILNWASVDRMQVN